MFSGYPKIDQVFRWCLRNWHWAALAALCAVATTGLTYIADTYYPQGVPDERDIVVPALQSLWGEIPVKVKYPHFSFYFFGLFFAFTGTLDDLAASMEVARVVNVALFGINQLLLFYFMRQLAYSRMWSFITALLFSTLPWVMLSGAMVKTEGLLLTQLFLVLVASQKITGGKTEYKWHALAGISAGAAVGTKYSIFPALLYLFHIGYLFQAGYAAAQKARLETESKTTRKRVAEADRKALEARRNLFRSLLLFSGLFFFMVWAGLPNWARLAESFAFYKNDPYFVPGAGPWKAVEEWGAFPFGRFSSFIFTTLPGSLGCFVFLAAGALFARALSPWELRVFGGATLAALILALSGTRMRLFHSFTMFIPFFVCATVAFLRNFSIKVHKREYQRIFFSIVAVAGLAQWIYFLSLVPHYKASMTRVNALFASITTPSISVMLTPEQVERERSSQTAAGKELPLTFQAQVAERRPQYILIFSSFLINMCKYKHNELYAMNCAYYEDLIHDRTEYKLLETIDIDIGKAISIDPEIRQMAIYFFEKPT